MAKRAAAHDSATAKEAPKESTKTQLIDAGIQIMQEKGYNNTGIMEVLQSVGVPKGSFYYYFESKEDFGLQIINHFDEAYSQRLGQYFDDKSLSPVQRLRSYCEDGRTRLLEAQCRKGCLIGNLSQEMADQSEVFRARLEQVMSKWRARFAECIKEAQEQGEICTRIDTVDLAEFFLSGWEGAVMRAKTTKNTGPQDAFIRVMFEHFLCKKS
jgi:TetR/AcrR family transcriptional regulator, transcriptional repressor for nem operon